MWPGWDAQLYQIMSCQRQIAGNCCTAMFSHSPFSALEVRNSEASWRDTRKQLRRDHRWDQADQLDRDEKEKLFEEHIENLTKRNKEMFHKLLEETVEV